MTVDSTAAPLPLIRNLRVPRGRCRRRERAGACDFVHSYHLQCRDAGDEAASIEFGGAPVTAAIERSTVYGTQFHPEKSQDVGLAVLHDLARLAGELAS